MLHNKIILIGILIMSISSALAWDEESGYAEGEEMEIVYVEGYDYFYNVYPEDPNWYDPIIKLLIRIKAFLFTDEDIEIDVIVQHEVWDSDAEEYSAVNQVQDTNTKTMHLDKNTTCDIPVISEDPIKEFFKNNTEIVETFKTRDDDPEHPDILNVSINISGAGLDVHEHGYTTLNDAALDTIRDGIETPDDYGFATSGRGSNAGGGGIYEGLNIYSDDGDGTNRGMGNAFSDIFYMLIPLLFVLCVFKFIFNLMGH